MSIQGLHLLCTVAITPPTPKQSAYHGNALRLVHPATAPKAASASAVSRDVTALQGLELLRTVGRSMTDATPPPFIQSAHIGNAPNQYFYLERLNDVAVVIALRAPHTDPYILEVYPIDQAPPHVLECIAKHYKDRLEEEARYGREQSCGLSVLDGVTASAPPSQNSELQPMEIDEIVPAPELQANCIPPPRLISPPSGGASKRQVAQRIERQAPVKKASGKQSTASKKASHKPPTPSVLSRRKNSQSRGVASGRHYLRDPWRALLEKVFEDITPEPPLNWQRFLAAKINSSSDKVLNWFANRRQNYTGIAEAKRWHNSTSACGQKMKQWDRKILTDEEFKRVVEEEYIPVLPQIVDAHEVLRSLGGTRYKGFNGRTNPAKKPAVKYSERIRGL